MLKNNTGGGGVPIVTYPFLHEDETLELAAQVREHPPTRHIISALEAACASCTLSRQDDSLTNQLLRFTVVMKVLHREGACNERVLAPEIWGIRDHNPALDPRIRMANRLLSRKLAEYYKGEGRTSLIEFSYPYGFKPEIRHRGAGMLIDGFTCHTPTVRPMPISSRPRSLVASHPCADFPFIRLAPHSRARSSSMSVAPSVSAGIISM
jgi:hypothetical protein